MANIESCVNDPQDPRNRASFYVDFIVIDDEGTYMYVSLNMYEVPFMCTYIDI